MGLPILSYFVSMSLYIMLLFFFLDYTREKQNFYKWFFILALLSAPLWFINLNSWFRWAKTISILIPITFFNYVRISNDGNHDNVLMSLKRKWPLWFLYTILLLNILEASLTDFELGNNLNGLSGLILCVTAPLPTKHWRIGKNDGKNSFAEIIADLPLAWCLLYFTWNAAFVYSESPAFFSASLCILVVPEIWMFYHKRVDLWLQARVYTLAIHLLIRSCYDVFTPVMDSTAWFNERVLYFWGVLNICLHTAYLFYWFFKLRNKNYQIRQSAEAYGY